jgi:serine/threonine-protein kinase
MSTPSWIGRKLNDRYEIEDLLGQGGMSSVYRVNDPNLRRTVAVKMIHPHLSSDPNFVSRFEEEAASVAQLRHPNIIQVFDFANHDETYYMVLEFVPGETLEEHLKRLQQADRMMSIEDAVKYISNVCDALEYAHNRGLIHRDIKPANIMLNVQGEAILMDFGIAKIVGGKQHTASGAVVGTALYMSPEIIKGEEVDRRVDIYGLGVTLFETLTGQPPFQADSAMSVLMMHVNDPVPDLREINQGVPHEMVEVVKKALAKDKNDRYQSAAEFAQALRNITTTKTASTMVEEAVESLPLEGTVIEEQISQPKEVATMVEEVPEAIIPEPGSSRIPPPSDPTKASDRKRKPNIPLPVMIGGGIIGIIILVGAIILAVRPSQPEEQAAVVSTETATVFPSSTVELPSETPPPTATLEPTLAPTATDPAGPYAQINSIQIENGYYMVEYETFGYTEVLPGEHIHFFFNNIAPDQAGVGGSGPWYLWGGPRPFDGYSTGDRPVEATQLCALQANADHTINLNTGNCVDLPSE